MAEEVMMRLSLVARKLNVSIVTVIESLASVGHRIDNNPNAKLNQEQLVILGKAFGSEELMGGGEKSPEKKTENIIPASPDSEILYFRPDDEKPAELATPDLPKSNEPERIKIEHNLEGPKVIGKIDLDAKPSAKSNVVKPTPAPEVKEVAAVTEEKPTKVDDEPVVEKPVVVEKVELPKVEELVSIESTIQKVETPIVEQTKIETEAPKLTPEEPKQPANDPIITEQKAPEVEISKPAIEKPAEVKPAIEEEKPSELIKAKSEKLAGLTVLGKITLPTEKKPGGGDAKDKDADKKKRKRKRVSRLEKLTDITDQEYYNKKKVEDKTATGTTPAAAPANANKPNNNDRNDRNKRGGNNTGPKKDVNETDVKDSIKQTMAKMASKGPDFGAKHRREKRKSRAEQAELDEQMEMEASSLLKVTEFISAAELSSMMDVSVNDVIATCMKMGMFVSINQRLDAESIQMIALEYNFDVEFISAEEEIQSDAIEIEDKEEDLEHRAPIVTIMGHVDHGKTSLLDYIRRTKVASGEAGGITQHIGAYKVKINEGENAGKSITFLDTPGHEAFTAMRARGAKVTDVVIIVVAADDSVMPQTREAINHAQNAGVPIVFALNKIDKAGANADKIREDLSKENILVESWGGKYQEQEVSAKSGIGIDELLDKVLLEAELLELKANPNRKAAGTIIEASLDKGRGYVSTVLIETGTLHIGDIILAGQFFGRVRAMIDDLGQRIKVAGPSTPVQLLGLPGAPQAGDKFNAMETDREAREIANKREQIKREQSIRAKRHITLDEIGRRKAIGSFKELNIIVKGDVDGSVEALSDSLLKLTTDEVSVKIVHKGVGQISESDVLLSSAADAIIIGFQVRPSNNAKRLAEQEEIEIRLYSIIYDAINEIKDAMEGMLAPTVEEVVTGNIEVREIFKISKVGTIAGSYVLDGYIHRKNKVRIIRSGIVLHEGEIEQLKRYKDDVAEVKAGYECGININKFNDLQEGDIIESFEMRELKRSL